MNIALYHLSESNDIKVLHPQIPENGLAMYEELITPRVCFSDSVNGCLSAIQQGGELYYYVYVPVNDELKFIIPTKDQVCDAFLTGEVWMLHDVDVKCIGVIKTSGNYNIINRISIINRIGKKDTVALYEYDWRWIDKYEGE